MWAFTSSGSQKSFQTCSRGAKVMELCGLIATHLLSLNRPARGHSRTVILVASTVLGISGAPFQSSQMPIPRSAEWGTLTSYADAAVIDSPLRQARNQFWNGKASEGPLTDNSRPSLLNYPTTHPHITDLELQGSAAVVVGVIRAPRSYLSADKTTIYTEFTLRVQQILANNSGRAVDVASMITLARAGGVVRLPSGKILIRGCQEESMPHMTRRYVFVLT